MSLSTGLIAPNFSLEDTQRQRHQLADFAGKWVLLYFYPKDGTPGCTKEACGFRDAFSELRQYITVIGISGDSVQSHQQFAINHQLPFLLLADPDKKVIHDYQIGGAIFPRRVSFLINPAGQIAKIYDKVNVNTHAQQILKDVQRLQQTSD